MKIKNKALMACCMACLTSTVLAAETPWSVSAGHREFTVVNERNSTSFFSIKTKAQRVVDGHLIVRANNVKLFCEDNSEKGGVSVTVKAGESGSCFVKPHGKVTVTMVPGLRHNWGSEGTYQLD